MHGEDGFRQFLYREVSVLGSVMLDVVAGRMMPCSAYWMQRFVVKTKEGTAVSRG